MCRNIKTLFNFDPPATDDEIKAAALQFMRKISGFRSPSRANETAFNEAIEQISLSGRHLLQRLTTTSPARDREVEAAWARPQCASIRSHSWRSWGTRKAALKGRCYALSLCRDQGFGLQKHAGNGPPFHYEVEE